MVERGPVIHGLESPVGSGAKGGEEIVRFSSSHLETLISLARGLTYGEIATEYGIPETTLKGRVIRLRKRIAAKTTLQLLDYTLETGQIPAERITEGFDFNLFETLTPRERKIVVEMGHQLFTKNYKQIAENLKRFKQTTKNQISSIMGKLGLMNHIQVRLYGKYLPEELKGHAF